MKAHLATDQAAPAETSVRMRVLWMTVLLYGITYMDRVCMSAAAPVVRGEFGFTTLTLGLVFSAFAWGYSLFQIPSGWLADRLGPRRMLSGIVMWWSLFTILTAAAWSASSLVLIRFLFGVGEAGAFPSATRAFSRWLPTSERGFAQGITHSGSRFAGALTPVATAGLISLWGWRTAFTLFGIVGMIWAVIWFWWYRDRPEDHPSVSPSELARINSGKSPHSKNTNLSREKWQKLLRSPNMWFVCIMYFCYGYVLWIFLNWLPTYFSEVRGFSLVRSGIYAGIPLLAGTVTNGLGGWLSDRLYLRTRNLCFSRRIISVIGFSIAVAFVALGVMASSPGLAILWMSIAVAGLELTTGVSWALPLDIAPDHAGTVSGVMNMFGNLGGALSPIVFALLLERFNSWTPPFLLASGLCVVAGLAWFKIDADVAVVNA
jgi:sugar phosphate permease